MFRYAMYIPGTTVLDVSLAFQLLKSQQCIDKAIQDLFRGQTLDQVSDKFLNKGLLSQGGDPKRILALLDAYGKQISSYFTII